MREAVEKMLADAIEHYKAQRYAQVESLGRQLTSLPSPTSRSCFLLGLALGKTNRWPEAGQWLEKAAALDPTAPEVWSEFGRACNALRDYARAADCFRRFIELRPANADGYFCLGNAYQQLGQHERAVTLYGQAVGLNPKDAAAWNNLGKALSELNRLPEAVTAYDRALALEPDSALARRNRAINLLKTGRWQEGWRDYEWRRSALVPRPYPQPKWKGEVMPDQTLFIYAEQGIGDSIQFVRFVPLAQTRVGRVILECQRPLKRWFEHCGGADVVVAVGETPPPFDAYVALASLPGIFDITPDKITGDPYLQAPLDDVAPLVASPNLKVGLVWAGNAEYGRDTERSIRFEQLEPILDVKQVAFFSFQVGLPARDTAGFRAHSEIVNLADRLNDFWDTAAFAANMDLIISVDTAMAHLAGALGKPAWTLVPFASDWRWLLGRTDTIFYQTMRLFRQSQRNDWHTTMLHVRDELTRMAKHRHL